MLKIDGFDDCLIGIASRCGDDDLLVYSTARIYQKLMERDGMTMEEAIEYAEFNIIGSYMGEHTPLFVTHCTMEEVAEVYEHG